jgi:hypothetical protein
MTGSRLSQSTVRRADAADVEAIVEMARLFAPEVGDPPARITARQLLRDGLARDRWYEILMAEQDGRRVGYVMTTRTVNPNTGERGLHIEDL